MNDQRLLEKIENHMRDANWQAEWNTGEESRYYLGMRDGLHALYVEIKEAVNIDAKHRRSNREFRKLMREMKAKKEAGK